MPLTSATARDRRAAAVCIDTALSTSTLDAAMAADSLSSRDWTSALSWRNFCWQNVVDEVWQTASPYLLMSFGLTVVSILFGWWYVLKASSTPAKTTPKVSVIAPPNERPVVVDDAIDEGVESSGGDEREDGSDDTDDDAGIKRCRQQPIRIKRLGLKTARRKVEQNMNSDQRQREREAEAEQLAAVFALMQEHQDKFGGSSMDDVKSQMKLYV